MAGRDQLTWGGQPFILPFPTLCGPSLGQAGQGRGKGQEPSHRVMRTRGSAVGGQSMGFRASGPALSPVSTPYWPMILGTMSPSAPHCLICKMGQQSQYTKLTQERLSRQMLALSLPFPSPREGRSQRSQRVGRDVAGLSLAPDALSATEAPVSSPRRGHPA